MPDILKFMFVRLDNARDLLSDALFGARLGGILMSRSTLCAPFALAFAQDAVRPGLHLVRTGSCWIIVEGQPPVRINAGDLVLLPHGSAHRLCDDPQTPPVSVSELAPNLPPGGEMRLPFGQGSPEVEVMCCAYDVAHTTTPTLRGLPTLVHVSAARAKGSVLPGLLALLQDESTAMSPGTALIRSRLIDLVFVHALRLWLEDGQGGSASWIDAVADPFIGPVLQAVHENPGHGWTIATLAGLARQSRAVFCKKFCMALGEPPMNYVAKLRMAEAARQLADGVRISDVAAAVGYSNEFAFAKAFKRTRGVAPGRVRRGV